MSLLKKHNAAKDDFAQISNTVLRDRELSPKAIGIFCHLWSHVEGWTTSAKHLASTMKIGRGAITSALVELETHGYLIREVHRNPDGTIAGGTWHLTDDPKTSPLGVSKAPGAENPAEDDTTLKNTIVKNTILLSDTMNHDSYESDSKAYKAI